MALSHEPNHLGRKPLSARIASAWLFAVTSAASCQTPIDSSQRQPKAGDFTQVQLPALNLSLLQSAVAPAALIPAGQFSDKVPGMRAAIPPAAIARMLL